MPDPHADAAWRCPQDVTIHTLHDGLGRGELGPPSSSRRHISKDLSSSTSVGRADLAKVMRVMSEPMRATACDGSRMMV